MDYIPKKRALRSNYSKMNIFALGEEVFRDDVL